jgi:hypothetical protein
LQGATQTLSRKWQIKLELPAMPTVEQLELLLDQQNL